jgi:hypothetical protein
VGATDLPGQRVLHVGEADGLPDGAGWTIFNTATRHVSGVADGLSGRLANELRRYGIRFYSRGTDGRYRDWEPNPPQFGP